MVTALRMTLGDLGGSIHLDQVPILLGRPLQRAALIEGARNRLGPFQAPAFMVKNIDGVRVEIVLHAVGVVSYRISKDIDDPWAAVSLPDPIERWDGEVAAAVAPALYERYQPPDTVETWDIRILGTPVGDQVGAEAWVLGDAPREDNEPVLLRRRDGGVLVGRDRVVIWSPDGDEADIVDILEVARAELVEFRAYDGYLDRRLDQSFASVDKLWSRWGLLRSARATLRDLSHVRVEVARLTDPLHGTGKAFGDRFTERLHATLQGRLRIDTWEKAVVHKTDVMEDMFHLAQEESNHRRALVLESMIVLLFIVDLILLWKVG